MRTASKGLFLTLLLCGATEGICLVGLFVIEQRMLGLTYDMVLVDKLPSSNRDAIRDFISRDHSDSLYDPSLGWVEGPTSITGDANIDPKNSIRIAAFGDSFTERSGIQKLALEREGLEVVNFGVGGYGLDQSYLRYLRDGATSDFDIVLIGFMTENSNRNLNVFRHFYLPFRGAIFSKPRFRIKDGELDNPTEAMKELGANDYYFGHRPKSSVVDFSAAVRLVKLGVKIPS